MRLRRSRGDWLGDVWFVAAGWLLAALFVLAARSERGVDVPPVGVEVGVVLAGTGLLLLWRRHRPVLSGLLLIVAEVAANGGIGMAGLAVYNVGLRRRWQVAVPVAATHVLVVSGLYALAEPSGQKRFESFVVLVLVHATLVSLGLLVRSQRLLVQAAREQARQAREEQRLRVEEARHHERERLAREMHDVLAHRISLLALHAGALEYRGTLPPAEARAATVIRQCAHDALEDLREVIGMLRDDPDSGGERPQPALRDLPDLIGQSLEAGVRITVEDRIADPDRIPDRIGRHAYRIVQEGLINARKHAPGAVVRVRLETSAAGTLTVEVVNPPPVGPAHGIPGAGAGLIGLGERVALAGGGLEHGHTPVGDFRLHAWLPLPR